MLANTTFDMAAAIGTGITGIQEQVMAILAVVAPAAIVITGAFIGLRMALKAFRKIG
jgi:chromate transport protein ChrA